MALYLGNVKIAGCGTADVIPDTYKTYDATLSSLSGDGYATESWVKGQNYSNAFDPDSTTLSVGGGSYVLSNILSSLVRGLDPMYNPDFQEMVTLTEAEKESSSGYAVWYK
jgi:hypothetical protein